ncbi:MAG: hypothetical protein IJX62_02055 [Clostridia bacterium]|nr:hypothetical protein [Clostridia bacterium]
MAKIKPRRAFSKELLSGFGGLGARESVSGGWAADMRNFRICSDGALEKRSGWLLKREFTDPIRAVWKGTVHGEELNLAVCATVIFRFTDAQCTVVGRVSDASGRLTFFRLGTELYLTDRSGPLMWNPDTGGFEAVVAYAPLYGHNWHPTSYGDVNEPLNLLSSSLRIHYFNTNGSTAFSLPFFAESIDHVRVDNREVTEYSLNGGGDTLTVPSASTAATVEVAYTMAYAPELAEQAKACRRCYVDRRDGEERLFFYGAPQGYRVFPACSVSDSMKNYCRVFYPKAEPLYLRQEDLLNIGDAKDTVQTLCRQYDRLLAFCADSVWSVFDDDEVGTDAVPVLSGFGCSGADAVATDEKGILVFYKCGLYRLYSTSGNPDDFRLTCLSKPIAERLSVGSQTEACIWVDPMQHEVWVRRVGEGAGDVWIWNADTEQWYCFDGIYADFFLSWGDAVGFASDKQLCLFDSTLSTDNGQPFSAYYQSGYLSFSSPETLKRALRIALCATPKGNTLHLLVETEQTAREFQLAGKSIDAPQVFDRRMAPGRFRFLRFRIGVTGQVSPRIHNLALYSHL